MKQRDGGAGSGKGGNATLRQLRKLYDPAAFCVGLSRVAGGVDKIQANCDHTFKQSRAALARFAPSVDADAYIAILEAGGAHCDCEVALNVCPDTGV